MELVLDTTTPAPRCLQVTGDQVLRVVNETSTVATFFFAHEMRSIQPRGTINFTATFASIWQPGVHDLQSSTYNRSGPDLYLSVPVVSPSAPACSARDLKLLLSQPISEATGQHTTELAVENTSRTACNVDGYPHISLRDRRGRVVPFVYRYGGDQMLTLRAPTRIGLLPGGYAYFAINKYRCDARIFDGGVSMRASLPMGTGTISLHGVSVDYCGPGDPGSLIAVTPFEINLWGTASDT